MADKAELQLHDFTVAVDTSEGLREHIIQAAYYNHPSVGSIHHTVQFKDVFHKVVFDVPVSRLAYVYRTATHLTVEPSVGRVDREAVTAFKIGKISSFYVEGRRFDGILEEWSQATTPGRDGRLKLVFSSLANADAA